MFECKMWTHIYAILDEKDDRKDCKKLEIYSDFRKTAERLDDSAKWKVHNKNNNKM